MSTSHLGSTQPRATTGTWAILGVLMVPVLLVSVDNTALSFALPQISATLKPSGVQLLWIVDIYMLMLAGLLIGMGSLGDRIGRRRLLTIGAAGFGAASLFAAVSPNPEMLLLARALQGVFGATLMPSTLSLIRNIFVHPHDRRIAIATWAAMFSGGAALGPIVGGWLLGHFWWGSIFLINVPLIAAFVPLALWLIPESKDPNPGPFNVWSIVLSFAAMAPIVFAIKHVATTSFDDVATAALALGVAATWAFVRRQRRLPRPMLDLALFRNRVFRGAVIANMLSLAGYAGFLFFAAQLLQLVLGLTPMQSAFVLVPGLVVTIVAGFLAVHLVKFIPVRVVIAGSFAASACGYALTAFFGDPTVASIMVAFAIMGLGIGLAETLTNDLMLAHAPAAQAGSAAAISETGYEVGAVLGTAVLGSIVTASYTASLAIPAVLGDGSARAFETVGGTLQYAAYYPNGLGDALIESARQAFDVGVQRASAAAILVALLAAIVAWRTMPRTRIQGDVVSTAPMAEVALGAEPC